MAGETMQFSRPSRIKELVHQANRTGGSGMPTAEARLAERQSQSDRLKSLKYPNLAGKNWKPELHTWMQTVLDAFLGFHVEVPEPPDFNRAQRWLMKKFKLLLFFVPQIEESQYPEYMVKLDWNRFLSGADVTSLSLPGRWIAFEVIKKPNYQDGKYPDDQLMAAVGIETRFGHPYSGKREDDDLMNDIFPKVVKALAPIGDATKVQSVKLFNFMGNLFNWLTQNTIDSFPDLGATVSLEWCEECYGSQSAIIVGDFHNGGLGCVDGVCRDSRNVGIAFRFLAVF